jgi:hypothetical protein
MTWGTDLALGQKYEKLLVDYLNPDSHSFNNNNEYDVLIVKDGKETKYEVKADRMMIRTNNMCIEIECSGRPSGIQTTHAEFYAYFEVGSSIFYIIPVSIIKESIIAGKYMRTINGGDGYRARFHLFNRKVFDDYKIEWKCSE